MLRIAALSALIGLMAARPALAAEDRTLCVYDPMGTNGPVYHNAQKFAVDALAQGVKFTLRADIEEKAATADLVAGKCDAAIMTGVATRSFGLASSTVEAIGALPKYSWLKSALRYLADARLASKMVAGNYEVAGIYPGGAVMLYSHDKNLRRAADLAGKSIAIIGDDVAAATMAREVGAATKSATTATFGPMFNSSSVDAAYAPATAYEPLELYRGIGANGGIIDFPLSQFTLQIVIRKDRFPEGFGQWGRTFAYSQFDAALEQVKRADAKIASKLIQIPDEDKPGYEDKFLKVRLTLRDKGVYDKTILGLLRRVRCSAEPTRGECAAPQE